MVVDVKRTASQAMSNEAKYLAVLSSAIAQIEVDSFEARGTVYDRLWQIVLQQLQAEYNDSEENISRERAAFLRAVQRIEFGERSSATDVQTQTPDVAPPRPRRSVFGRVCVQMAGALAVMIIVLCGYLLFLVRTDAASVQRWANEGAPNSWQSKLMRAIFSINEHVKRRPTIPSGPSQRAVLYEESATAATGRTFGGQAVWRHYLESGTGGASATVLSVDVEIPQKTLTLKVTLRRAPESGGAISHLVEFRFLDPDRSGSEAVENVVGVLMKNDELTRGIELVGKVVRVQRGIFLMGLSSAESDLGRNVKLLRERSWLDIAIIMKDGTRNILAIEKGSTGQSAVNQALASWGQS